MAAWGRLGVPESGDFEPKTWPFMFWHRADDGSTIPHPSEASVFRCLDSSDVLEQMRPANATGADQWNDQLDQWIRDVVLPAAQQAARDDVSDRERNHETHLHTRNSP